MKHKVAKALPYIEDDLFMSCMGYNFEKDDKGKIVGGLNCRCGNPEECKYRQRYETIVDLVECQLTPDEIDYLLNHPLNDDKFSWKQEIKRKLNLQKEMWVEEC